jgi:hypothetical protein
MEYMCAWGIGGRARLQLSLGLNSIRVKLAQTGHGTRT